MNQQGPSIDPLDFMSEIHFKCIDILPTIDCCGSLISGLLFGALSRLPQGKGLATHCDIVHLRWDVPKSLQCIKIACDALRCIFQHVGNLAPDFGIFQNHQLNISNYNCCDDHHRSISKCSTVSESLKSQLIAGP